MSADSKKKSTVGYVPPDTIAPEPMMTASQYQNQQTYFLEMVQTLKNMFEESPLRKYIIMAGVSALIAVIIEIAHVAWLAWRYLGKF
jgi:hypothetical protein